jgi:hypothetical protein
MNAHEFCYGLLPSEMADPSVTEVTPIIIKAGETGYYPTDWKWRKDNAEEVRDQKNARLGITPEEADRMMAASMAVSPAARSYRGLIHDLKPAFERGERYPLTEDQVASVFRLRDIETAGAARDWKLIRAYCPKELA